MCCLAELEAPRTEAQQESQEPPPVEQQPQMVEGLAELEAPRTEAQQESQEPPPVEQQQPVEQSELGIYLSS